MRLKTIREQLLFAVHYHHQLSKKRLEEYHSMEKWPNKSFGKQARQGYMMHRKMSEAIDAALELL
jgi:hypothetical protein